MNFLMKFNYCRRKRIEESHATIKSQHLPTIKNKRTPIRQILQNLIENALKYHKPGVPPVIKVSFSETKRFWEFTIKDNGVGIDPEYHDKIFIIFQRLENIESHKGTGMGLALAKKSFPIWVEIFQLSPPLEMEVPFLFLFQNNKIT